MKTIKTLAILASLVSVSLAGCGSKAKPPATVAEQPATDTTTPSTEKPAPVTEKTDTDVAGPNASLHEIIYFEFDSAELGPDARAELEANAAWLKEDAARTLTIEGHTDEVGTNEYNLGLGERRARISKEYLVRLGVEDKRVQVITYGEEKLASPEDAKNRRSVFVATKSAANK